MKQGAKIIRAKSISVIAVALIALFIAGSTAISFPRPYQDGLVIGQLEKAGSNLHKLHEIEFFLYFKKKDLAERAGKLVAAEGCKVKVERGAGAKAWLCHATKRMVPEMKALSLLRKRFNGIAKKCDGEYDGWGAQVVK